MPFWALFLLLGALKVWKIWVGQMPKMLHFSEFFKTWSMRSNSVTRQVSFNRTKIGGKCQNSNTTFRVIFKQCVCCRTKCIFPKYVITNSAMHYRATRYSTSLMMYMLLRFMFQAYAWPIQFAYCDKSHKAYKGFILQRNLMCM